MGDTKNERLELQTKAFVADLLAGVNTADHIENMIGYIIEEVGIFTHADRVCIYEPDAGDTCWKKMYLWQSENLAADDAKAQNVRLSQVETWSDILNQKQLVVVEDCALIRKTTPSEYGVMEDLGMKGLLMVPVYGQENVMACLCVVNPDFTAFSVVESTLLLLGRQMGTIYRQDKFNHKYGIFMEGIRSSNLSEFIVDCNTGRYEAFRITRVLNNTIPEEGEWEWLRHFYASIIKPEYKEQVLRRTEYEYMKSFLSTDKSTFTIDIEREVNGINAWFRLEFSVASLSEAGQLERFVLLVKDITQMKREEEERQQVITALSSIYTSTAMIDLQQKISKPIQFSHIARQSLPNEKVPAQEITEMFCSRLVQRDYADIVREFMDLDTMQQRLAKTKVIACEFQGTRMEWGRITITPAKWNANGALEKVVFALQDISGQKQREERMQYRIEHDELTGTLNRAAFNRVTKLLEESVMPFALVLMDIDRFKGINDTYGHDVGDEVLTRLAMVLNEKMRMSDEVFRLGGDEFAIVMNRVTLEQSGSVKQIIESINESIMSGLDGLPPFSVSAGVTFSVSGYDEKTYRNADQALYRTKETTRRGCSVYEEIAR
ncbi:MAG: diguanylate cyclase domain-containing protein [Roseburia sp.]